MNVSTAFRHNLFHDFLVRSNSKGRILGGIQWVNLIYYRQNSNLGAV